MMIHFPAITKAGASLGTVMSVVGLIDADKLVTWSGAALALASAVATWGWGQYHAYREARRKEDAADAAAALERIRTQAAAEAERDRRIADNADQLAILDGAVRELVERVRAERCPFALDGHAKCAPPAAEPAATD